MAQRVKPYRYTLAAFAILALASGVSVALLASRVWYAHAWQHIGLIWNLFLAWIPLGLSVLIAAAYRVRLARFTLVPALGVLWLLFFPNAPYIVTDLVNLRELGRVPLWFDALMIMSFAWTGLLAGFVSLYLVQRVVTQALGRVAGWLFVVGVVGLTSVGIYLGRFLRWNSWDVFVHPFGLSRMVLEAVLNPLLHVRALAFSAMFATFFILAYLILFVITHLRPDDGEVARG